MQCVEIVFREYGRSVGKSCIDCGESVKIVWGECGDSVGRCCRCVGESVERLLREFVNILAVGLLVD